MINNRINDYIIFAALLLQAIGGILLSMAMVEQNKKFEEFATILGDINLVRKDLDNDRIGRLENSMILLKKAINALEEKK